MVIDWFTIIAQMVNFLILVWLMKRFLFKPILKAIDAREKRIALALADADGIKAEALRQKKEFQRKNEQFDQERLQRLDTVTSEANAERQRLLEEARKASDDFSAKRQEAWQREQLNMTEELISRTRDEVFSISRKTLKDLADLGLEERMLEVFRANVQGLSKDKKAELSRMLHSSSSPALIQVRSAYPMSPEQQKATQQTLGEIFPAGLNVSFETVPELISGIELTANGHKLAWSIQEYLSSLAKNVNAVFQEEEKQTAAASKELR